jgi:hypothetical protein
MIRNKIKYMGTISNSRKGNDDGKTLRDAKFEAGDYMDIAILPGQGPAGGNNRMGMGDRDRMDSLKRPRPR